MNLAFVLSSVRGRHAADTVQLARPSVLGQEGPSGSHQAEVDAGSSPLEEQTATQGRAFCLVPSPALW
jgi:hypothetical protein